MKAKLHRSMSSCRVCIDMAESCNALPHCETCFIEVTVVSTHSSLFGGYAIIQRDSKLEQVSLDRLEVNEP